MVSKKETRRSGLWAGRGEVVGEGRGGHPDTLYGIPVRHFREEQDRPAQVYQRPQEWRVQGVARHQLLPDVKEGLLAGEVRQTEARHGGLGHCADEGARLRVYRHGVQAGDDRGSLPRHRGESHRDRRTDR